MTPQQTEWTAEEKLEDLTVRLAYVNVWLQSIDGTGVDDAYMRQAIPALWRVLEGEDRRWLDEANAKTQELNHLRSLLRDVREGLAERAKSFHDFINTTAERGSHMHTGADGDPRFEKCLHSDCKAARDLLTRIDSQESI